MAAGIKAAHINVAASTSLGTQDITISGFGTVTGYIITMIAASGDGTDTDHAIMSTAFSDGTTSRMVRAKSEDGQSTSDDIKSSASGLVAAQFGTTTDLLVAQAIHDSFITDGIRIEWITFAPPAANRLQVMLLGGDDLSIHVGFDANNSGVGTERSITAPGFQPNAVLFLEAGAAANFAQFPLGAAYDNGAGFTQGMVMACSEGEIGTTKTNCANYNNRVGAEIVDANVLLGYTEFDGFEANGFSVTRRVDSTNPGFAYMALASSTNKMFAGIKSVPSGTGNVATTGIGFKPQAVFVGLVDLTVNNVIDSSGNNAGNISFGMFDDTRESSFSLKLEDNRGTSDTVCRWDSNAQFLQNKVNTTRLNSSFVSFDSDGYTLNYATNAIVGAKQLVIAFEENAPDTLLKDPILGRGVVPWSR